MISIVICCDTARAVLGLVAQKLTADRDAVKKTVHATLGGAGFIWFNGGMRMMSNRVPRRISTATGRVLAVALAVAMFAAACDRAGDPGAQQWLHGVWELTFNPARDSEDDLVFTADGSVQVHTGDNRVITGQYRVNGDDLMLVLLVNDKPVEVHFEIAPDHSRLTYDNGAYYTRRPSP